VEQYESFDTGVLKYTLHAEVTKVDEEKKTVTTNRGETYDYDILVLATGSTAILPKMPGWDSKGVFVYRTVDDLKNMIDFSVEKKDAQQDGIVIGGGLLGLEAAKAMLDLDVYNKITVVEAMPYVLGRQLDADAGAMVVEQVKGLGVEVVLGKMVNNCTVDDEGNVTGIEFKDGSKVEGACLCFAVRSISQLIFLLLTIFRLELEPAMTWQRTLASSVLKEVAY